MCVGMGVNQKNLGRREHQELHNTLARTWEGLGQHRETWIWDGRHHGLLTGRIPLTDTHESGCGQNSLSHSAVSPSISAPMDHDPKYAHTHTCKATRWGRRPDPRHPCLRSESKCRTTNTQPQACRCACIRQEHICRHVRLSPQRQLVQELVLAWPAAVRATRRGDHLTNTYK
jgi:hypothetical protein